MCNRNKGVVEEKLKVKQQGKAKKPLGCAVLCVLNASVGAACAVN